MTTAPDEARTAAHATAEALHAIADFIDNRPGVDVPHSVHVRCTDKASVLAWRTMLGNPPVGVLTSIGRDRAYFRGHICGLHIFVIIADEIALTDPAPAPAPRLADWLTQDPS